MTESNTKVMGIIIALLGVVVIISLILVCFYAIKMYNQNPPENNTTGTNLTEENISENSCLELGCSSTAKYVGSKNSDKYYLCSCRYAKNINSENIICFDSDEDAVSRNYTKVDC